MKIILPAGKKKPLIRLDYPAIHALFAMYQVPADRQAQELEKLQLFFNVWYSKLK